MQNTTLQIKQPLKQKWTGRIDNSGKFHSALMGSSGHIL